MSGTSMEGIDAALLRSDGRGLVEAGPVAAEAYDEAFRARLRAVPGGQGSVTGGVLHRAA
jgi:anhydro-N-acetylmuramic acid kinase